MNRKGFTLVELLAVIVLIAVLTVVAVSTYHGIHESSKKKALNAKITELKAAAEKWGRENNITSKTNISVNTLVVEGYVTADEVNPSGLSTITNPVTGENMICNTIDLIFTNGIISSRYHSEIQNCNLATQSLVDTKINIRVVDSDNKTLSGSGSIAKWTNKDVVVIVNSNDYDPKATSISYDFEGNTTIKNIAGLDKYEGTNYITEAESKNYYNVFFVESSLLLNTNIVVTYDIPGEGTKSRAYTIRFDKEEATAIVTNNTDWLTAKEEIRIKVDDGKGSGPRYYYLSTDEENYDASNPKEANYNTTLDALEVGTYYIWTEDQAGNRSKNYKLKIEINNIDKEIPDCLIRFDGTPGDHGWYKEDPVTPVAFNTPAASISGVNIGISRTALPTYSVFANYQTVNETRAETVTNDTTRAGINYYCFAKSLAGQTGNGTNNLKLDRTPPTAELNVNNGGTYTRQKYARLTIYDELSGLNEQSTFLYGLSTSPTKPPTEWHAETMHANAMDRNDMFDFLTEFYYTGEYYMWVDVGGITDYAGNYFANRFIVSDLLLFDNTKPTCSVGNVTNQCTTDGISYDVTCVDEHSGVAVCAGSKTGIKSSQTYTVTDNAGNSNTCSIGVTSTPQYRQATCSEYATCENEACGTDCGGECTTLLCCRQDNTDYCEYQWYPDWDCTCWERAPYHNCSCSTYACGCETWNTWQAWQNTPITGCDGTGCKTDNRTVYHSVDKICNGATVADNPNPPAPEQGPDPGAGTPTNPSATVQPGTIGMCSSCTRDSDCYGHNSVCDFGCVNENGSGYRCCISKNTSHDGSAGVTTSMCN